MNKKSISIDQKLSSVLNYMCEREGLNPETLKSNDYFPIFPKGMNDIVGFRETVDYLKNYAKLQTISKSFSNQDALLKDIENAQKDFQKMIEKKLLQIDSIPRPKRIPKNLSIYEFEAEFQEFEEKKYKAKCEERKNKILSLKQDIKIYKDKIKKLESLKKSLSKPEKLMQILFPEEYTNIKENYARLVNLCVTSMTDGLTVSDLIGDDKVFRYDGKNYTVNYNNARKFLSVIKSKKELLSAAEFIKTKRDYTSKVEEYKKVVANKKTYDNFYNISQSQDFVLVTEKMNQMAEKYSNLKYLEKKMNKNFSFYSLRNKFRHFFHLPPKISKKVLKNRYELSSMIEEFTTQAKQNKNLEDAFMAYQQSSIELDRPFFYTLNQLEWAIPEIRRNGSTNVIFPDKPIDIKILSGCLKDSYDYQDNSAKNLRDEIKKINEKQLELSSHLTAKTKKLLEKQNEDKILKYAEKYYGFGKNKDVSDFSYNENLSPSSAAIILESILGRKNISWEAIVDNYASILGKHHIEDEKIDISSIVNKKIDYLKEQLGYMVQSEKEDINR